jgi:GT2 family glycosyltransferase
MAGEGSGAAASDVAVAVVNYNTRDLLERCLRSVVAQGPADVVVVDNASQDGSAALVHDRFPDVRLIANGTNVGYGAGANQALRSTTVPFVLLVNADTEVQPGCIDALVKYGRRASRAGIVGPTIVDARDCLEPSYFPFPGTLDWLLENEPLAMVIKRIPPLKRRAVSLDNAGAPQRVPWVMGCAMLLRREAMEAVGGFDESYFMYYEEVDLCRRMTDAGWEVHFTPEARVTHVGGASTSQIRTAMLIRHFQSTVKYYRRHYSGPRLTFWLTALHAKRVALLARDSARLVTEADPAERQRLREQRRAWAAILRMTGDTPTRANQAVDAGEPEAR